MSEAIFKYCPVICVSSLILVVVTIVTSDVDRFVFLI